MQLAVPLSINEVGFFYRELRLSQHNKGAKRLPLCLWRIWFTVFLPPSEKWGLIDIRSKLIGNPYRSSKLLRTCLEYEQAANRCRADSGWQRQSWQIVLYRIFLRASLSAVRHLPWTGLFLSGFLKMCICGVGVTNSIYFHSSLCQTWIWQNQKHSGEPQAQNIVTRVDVSGSWMARSQEP